MNLRLFTISVLVFISMSSRATPLGNILLAKIINSDDEAFVCIADESSETFPVRGLQVLESAEDGGHMSLELKAGKEPQVMSSAHCLKIGFTYPQYAVEGDLDWAHLQVGRSYSVRIYRIEDAENPYTFLDGTFCVLRNSGGRTEYINSGDAGSAHDRARCRSAWEERQRVTNELER